MLVVNSATSGLARHYCTTIVFKRRRQNVDKMGEYFVDLCFCICTFLHIKHDPAAVRRSVLPWTSQALRKSLGLRPLNFLWAQAIFHRISLLLSQYRYSLTELHTPSKTLSFSVISKEQPLWKSVSELKPVFQPLSTVTS